MSAPLPRVATDRTQSLIGTARERKMPSRGAILRRRRMVRLGTFLLPAFALSLLSAVALWPHISKLSDSSRVTYRRMTSLGGVDAAVLTRAHYRGADEHENPYTLTAETATQADAERINLVHPKGDATRAQAGGGAGGGGTWQYLEAERGVFMQRDQLLDLSGRVKLYRDDGTTLRTDSLTMDLRTGIASGNEVTHVEGPFGTVDAAGVVVTEKGAVLHFPGPATLVSNGAGK